MADDVPPANSRQSQNKPSETQSESKTEAPQSQSQAAQSQAAQSQSQAAQSQAAQSQAQPSQTQSVAEPRQSQSKSQPPPSATPSEPQQSQAQARPSATNDPSTDRKSGSVAPELQSQAQGGAASTSTTVGKRGSKKSDKDSNELIKKEGKKDDKAPADLAGTLQNLFTQTEQAEAPVLKPLRRPKVSVILKIN